MKLRSRRLVTFLVCVLAGTITLPISLQAHDWFVRAGSSGGDGSRAQPFNDPWEALERCTSGDVIHVAQGQYFGRAEAGYWVIPFADITLLGGYDADFEQRNPWTNPSELLWKKGSKNSTLNGRIQASGKDHSNTVIDGFIIDMREENDYSGGSLILRMAPNQPITLGHPGVTIRNNVIVNSAAEAIHARHGMIIENNVIVNSYRIGILVDDGSTLEGFKGEKRPVQIRNNTILFTGDERSAGKGGAAGINIETDFKVDIVDNILAHADNHAIVNYRQPLSNVRITGNVFHMNLFSNFKFTYEGQDVAIDNEDWDLMEDIDLADNSGNQLLDPRLRYPTEWLDQYSRRKAATRGKVTMNEWNKVRSLLGLPLIAEGGKAASNFMPPWDWRDAVQLATPGSSVSNAGARARQLPVEFSAAPDSAGVAEPALDYQPSRIVDWHRDPATVDKVPVELVVARGREVKPRGLEGEVTDEKYRAVYLHDADHPDAKIYGYYLKGSQVERIIAAAWQYNDGPVTQRFVVRGIARKVQNFPQGGVIIDQITEQGAVIAAKGDRPEGRDWFVRAGASGGDGSREKPFKDPYKALKKATPGDRIHVTGGEYTGFLNTGNWTIEQPYLALFGGYSDDFAERDPWAYPSLLFWKKGKTKPRTNTIVGGTNDHEGFILDGFVFDRRNLNVYASETNIDDSMSKDHAHVWLNARDTEIRNCVFVNGGGGALRLTSEHVIENNIFMNHVGKTVDLKHVNDTHAPSLFKHNTFLFTWNRPQKVGTAAPSGYGLLVQRGKARVEANVFQFMDNHGVKLETDAANVELVDNVYSHNLFSNVMLKSQTVIDDSTMHLLKDLGLGESHGDRVKNPNYPIAEAWFDIYLNRSAGVPGKVTMDDWNQLRQLLGKPLIATGGTAGTGYAPAYEWRDALKLFPRDASVTAGAHRIPLEVEYR